MSENDNKITATRPASFPQIPCLPEGSVVLGEILGHGGFGCVYRGKYKTMPVAVKKIMSPSLSADATRKMVQNELKLLWQLRHSNFVCQLIGYQHSNQLLSIVMRLAENGDLQKYLAAGHLTNDWNTKARICLDIGKAVKLVHDENIIHGDLKAANVLLDKFLTPKLTDFGISKSFYSSISGSSSIRGTLQYVAPERFLHSEKKFDLGELMLSDNYGYGLILWETATDGATPYNGRDDIGIRIAKMQKNNSLHFIGELSSDIPAEFRKLIQQYLEWEPSHRPSLALALRALEIFITTNPIIPPLLSSEDTTTTLIQTVDVFDTSTLENPFKDCELFTNDEISALSKAQQKLFEGSRFYFRKNNYQKAIEYLDKPELLDQAVVQRALGLCYLANNEEFEAFTSFKESAISDAKGQYYLAWCFDHGYGTDSDKAGALILYSLSAAHGVAEAASALCDVKWIQSKNTQLKWNGNADVITLIRVNVTIDRSGRSLLHWVVEHGHIEVVRLLVIELGVDVNVKDNSGQSPFYHAVNNGHMEVMRLLVTELGADVNAKDNYERTPLHLAVDNGHVEVIRLLVAEFGADVNAKEIDGQTLLHQAVREGHFEVVKLLVDELGANINAKNNVGQTPLDEAVASGHSEIVRKLKLQTRILSEFLVSLVKDYPSLTLGETLVHVEVSEIDPPAFEYSHSFKYEVPSGTDEKGKPFGEIIVYSDKNATSGNSFRFELEECRNLKCHKTHCEKCKEKHKNCKKEQAAVCKKEIENCRKESKGLCPVILGKENRLLVADIFHTEPKWLALQEFGAALFKALFSGYAGQLRQKIKPLHPNNRIYLQLNDNDLDAIPWEYANDSTVLLVHQCIFARVSKITQAPLSKIMQEFPLRIVAVIPDPLILPNEPGENLPDLRLSEQFQNFIDGFTKNGKTVKLERVFPPTVSQVGALLNPQAAMSTVLHFMGHCGHDGNTRALVFEHGETGKLQYINGSRLASELKNVKLAFLSACDSRDVARVLIERGIRFAIGSDCSIPDSLARKFEFEFYKFLANGSTVEMAMYQARAAFQEKDGNRQAYFACAMVLYLSTVGSTVGENDSMFKCEEGVPDVQLHMPRNNLMSTMPVFREYRKELADLYSQLRAMVFMGETSRMCTIKGIGGQEFVVEAMRRMAHLFPAGVFAWAFDKEKTSALKFFERLVDVIFSKEVGSRLREQSCNDAEKLGLAIIEQFQTANHATCLLILGDAEILNLGRKEKNIHAEKLGIWLEKVTSVRDTVKILLTSQEPLDWLKGELIDLSDSSNPIISRRGDIDSYFEYYGSTISHPQTGQHFYHVPGMNHGFVDRPEVIQKMHDALNKNSPSSECRILALKGLGGIGKTQLMLRYCYLHAAEYDSIFWLTVDSWNTAVHEYCKIASYLGLDEATIKEKDSEQKVINRVISWFGERTKWLLLLDNADGEMSKRIFELLPRKGGNIIFTTRQPTPPYKVTVIPVDKMQVQEAILLLYGVSSMDMINQKNADFNYAKEIVTEFDCLPLAIILARAYVERTATSLKGYLSKFKKEHKKLLGYKTDSDQYEYTVANVWQLSFERIKTLNSASAQILEACAFLHPESIPESLFKKQYAALKLKTPNEQDNEEIIGEAIAVLADFSFMSRIKSDDEEEAASLEIYRLVQKVIYDSMAHEQRLDWANRIVVAFYWETYIDMEAQHKSYNRKSMDLYLPHIRHLVALINKSDWKPFSSERLYDLLRQVSYYLIANEYSSGNEELLQTLVKVAEKVFGAEHEYSLVSLTQLASLYSNMGEYSEAEALFRQLLVIREKTLNETSEESVSLLANFALLSKRQGNFKEAEMFYLRVVANVENSGSPLIAAILNDLGEFYISLGNYDKAEEFHKRALIIRENDFGPDDVATSESLNNLAVLYVIRGNYSESERLQKRALEIREKELGPENTNTATSMSNLAVIHMFRGQYNEAEPLFQKAIIIFKKVCGPAHPRTATCLCHLAAFYESQGKFREAMPIAQETLDIRKEALGPEHPDTVQSLNNFGNICNGLGKHDEAEILYNQALSICKKTSRLEHPDTATALHGLASLYKGQNKHDEAEPLYNQALRIREKALGSEHPDTATALHSLASLYNDQSKYDKAKLLYQRALAIREKALGLEHPATTTVLRALSNIADIYFNQKMYDKAEPLYKQVAGLYRRQGRNEEAGRLDNQVLAMHGKALKSEHLETATLGASLAPSALGLEHPPPGNDEPIKPRFRFSPFARRKKV